MAIEARLENVSKKMGPAQALSALTCVFEAGLVHGIIGPNGAGKTTLMRILAGLLKADSGSVTFNTENAKKYTAYFPQEPSLYPDLSCMEHMEFFRDMYDINQKDFTSHAEELFNITGMADFKERPAGKLSGGMYKKLGLMCVLLNRPQLLLLDEPTIGVDPVSRRQLWELIYKFAGKEMTVIISTSYMDEAERASKLLVLDEGRALAAGKPAELKEKFKIKNFAEIFLKMKTDNKKSRHCERPHAALWAGARQSPAYGRKDEQQ